MLPPVWTTVSLDLICVISVCNQPVCYMLFIRVLNVAFDVRCTIFHLGLIRFRIFNILYFQIVLRGDLKVT